MKDWSTNERKQITIRYNTKKKTCHGLCAFLILNKNYSKMAEFGLQKQQALLGSYLTGIEFANKFIVQFGQKLIPFVYCELC